MTQNTEWKWNPAGKEYELTTGRVRLSAGRDFVKGDFYIGYGDTTNSYLEIARLRSGGIVVGEVGTNRRDLREITEPALEDLPRLVGHGRRFENLPTKKARNLAKIILEGIEVSRK